MKHYIQFALTYIISIISIIFTSMLKCTSFKHGLGAFKAGTGFPTRLFQILNADLVYREEGSRGSILGAHVGDGGAVSDGQLSNTRPEKLHKFSNHTNLPQMLNTEIIQ